MQDNNRVRSAYYDVARIIAILLVLLNHLPAYHLYASETGVAGVASTFLTIVIRINVPLFAMLSGALLLGREEDVATVLRQRVVRFLAVILLASGLLYLEFGALRDRQLSIGEFVHGVVAGDLRDFTSYWFLYAYLGFLLMLPFLRRIARGMTRGEFLLLVMLMFVLHSGFQLLNFVLRLMDVPPLAFPHSMSVPLVTVVLLFYPLVGFYLDRRLDVMRVTRRQWALLAALAVACSSVTMMVVRGEGHLFGYSQGYVNLFNFVNVIIVFLAIKRLFGRRFVAAHPVLTTRLGMVSKLVFGIYLFDPYLKLVLYEPMYAALHPAIGSFWYSVVWCVVSFCVCGLITYVLRLFAFVRRLL